MAALTTGDLQGFLRPELSAPIFDEARRRSVAQALIPQTPLGINGQKIPVRTSKATAAWVGEGAQKPTTSAGLGLLTIEPKKLAAIVVMSAEVVRANPGNIVGVIRDDLAEAFATAFDYAVFHGLGGNGTGSGPFDHYIAETTKSVALGTAGQAAGGVHADLNEGLRALVQDGRRLTGFALDSVVEPTLWGSVDANGRPLYVDLPTDSTAPGLAQPGRLLNRPSYLGDGVGAGDVVAFAGNWQKAAWGVVGGISYRISTEAPVTIDGSLVSLFERNLVAVLAEAEYGFVMESPEDFVKYTATVAGGGETVPGEDTFPGAKTTPGGRK